MVVSINGLVSGGGDFGGWRVAQHEALQRSAPRCKGPGPKIGKGWDGRAAGGRSLCVRVATAAGSWSSALGNSSSLQSASPTNSGGKREGSIERRTERERERESHPLLFYCSPTSLSLSQITCPEPQNCCSSSSGCAAARVKPPILLKHEEKQRLARPRLTPSLRRSPHSRAPSSSREKQGPHLLHPDFFVSPYTTSPLPRSCSPTTPTSSPFLGSGHHLHSHSLVCGKSHAHSPRGRPTLLEAEFLTLVLPVT